ncbi:MAG: response regulator transcription factor [Gaiellaceae bacterium]
MHLDPRPTAVCLEPCALLREAIALLLQRIGVRLVAATASPAQALELLRAHHPDLFLVELETPGHNELDAAECLRRGCSADPALTAVVLSSRDGDAAAEARRLGAAAYVHKSAKPSIVGATITAALERSRCGEPLWSTLTPREQEVLGLVSDGRTNAEVGKALWVSPDTVKFHLANVYRKLGVCNRSEAARWARMHAPALRGEPEGRRGFGSERVHERCRVDRPGRHAAAA